MEKLTKLAIAICRPKNSIPSDRDHTLPGVLPPVIVASVDFVGVYGVMLLFSFFTVWLGEADYGGFSGVFLATGTSCTIGACIGSEPRLACRICFVLVG